MNKIRFSAVALLSMLSFPAFAEDAKPKPPSCGASMLECQNKYEALVADLAKTKTALISETIAYNAVRQQRIEARTQADDNYAISQANQNTPGVEAQITAADAAEAAKNPVKPASK